MSQFYKAKRDVFEKYMKKYLDGLAQWDAPEAGMFFWSVRFTSLDIRAIN